MINIAFSFVIKVRLLINPLMVVSRPVFRRRLVIITQRFNPK